MTEQSEPDAQGAIDEAVSDFQAQAASKAPAEAATPGSPRGPRLLAVAVALLVLSAASAVYRIQAGAPEPPREALLDGAVLALERGADEVESLRLTLGKLPPVNPETAALEGLTYEVLGEASYALSVGLGPDTIRLEVAEGVRALSGPGTEVYPSVEGGGR